MTGCRATADLRGVARPLPRGKASLVVMDGLLCQSAKIGRMLVFRGKVIVLLEDEVAKLPTTLLEAASRLLPQPLRLARCNLLLARSLTAAAFIALVPWSRLFFVGRAHVVVKSVRAGTAPRKRLEHATLAT